VSNLIAIVGRPNVGKSAKGWWGERLSRRLVRHNLGDGGSLGEV